MNYMSIFQTLEYFKTFECHSFNGQVFTSMYGPLNFQYQFYKIFNSEVSTGTMCNAFFWHHHFTGIRILVKNCINYVYIKKKLSRF